MKILKSEQGKWHCLRVEERLDTVTAPEFETVGVESIEPNSYIAVDFSGLDYISSAGLRSILSATKKLKSLGGGLSLCGLSGLVEEVITVSGFDNILKVYPDVKQATSGEGR